jgi:hypothetical protein
MFVVLAANNTHSRRVYHDIARERTAILIRVLICIAHSNGLALASMGLTLRSAIAVSTPTLY